MPPLWLLAQTTSLPDAANPWPWLVGVLAAAVSFLFGLLYRNMSDYATKGWTQVEKLTTELAKGSDVMHDMTDVAERQRATLADLVGKVDTLAAKTDQLQRAHDDLVGIVQRLDPDPPRPPTRRTRT